MTPEQEKKFDEWYTWVMNNGVLVSLKPSARQTWQACLDANGIDKEPSPSLDDVCKSFESLAYSITKVSDKLTEAIERGCEKAGKEKAQAEWLPQEGEAVFVKDQYWYKIAIFIGYKDKLCELVLSDGAPYFTNGEIKPFDASKIGKKWEEI